MTTYLKIDRRFLFLHGRRLAVFTERILRNLEQNPYLPKPEALWEDLRESGSELRRVVENAALKRKERVDTLRDKETLVLVALGRMADYVERTALCKSDVFTAGFRAQTERRKVLETMRQQRVSAKLEKLEDLMV